MTGCPLDVVFLFANEPPTPPPIAATITTTVIARTSQNVFLRMPNIRFPEGVPSPLSIPIWGPSHMNLARLVSGLRADAARLVLGLHNAVVEIHRLSQPGARRKKT